MNIFAILALIFLALFGNILWFWLKSDLQNQGYETHFFRGHFNDLANAAEVVKKTDDPQTKKTYRSILYLIIGVVILMPTIFFTNIGSSEDRRCKRYNDYLNHQVIGTLESKFIDKPNHSYETLKLTNGKNDNKLTIFINGLYEFLQSGDSISKVSGSSQLTIFRSGKSTTFEVDRTAWCTE